MKNKHYQDLIEVQSLDKNIKIHLDAIDSSNQRIRSLEKQRAIKNAELQELQIQLKNSTIKNSELEKELSSLEKKISKSNEHISIAKNQQQVEAITKELETLTPKAEQIEEETLELLELMDKSNIDIAEINTYLEGSLESLNEITTEVNKLNAVEDKKIKVLEERINNLLSLVPPVFQNIFNALQEKMRFENPIAFINDHSCSHCRFSVDNTIVENVERGSTPEQCTSCSRMLLPLSATTSGS